MEIQLTSEQVLAMAPDAGSAAAAKKQSSAKLWKNLGMSADALWGECQGSALYQVKLDLASLSSQCSCPSRKFPCKHALGLLLLTTANGALVQEAEPPEWVADWLAKRQASLANKQKRAAQAVAETPSVSQIKTAEKRLNTVRKGVDSLDLWLNDLVRQGLASVQTQPLSFWEHQAARLRDAQAPALDSRLRRIALIPNSSANWPEKLLGELGKLALLTQAFGRLDRLEPGLREEVRQLVGWSLSQDEVNAQGETVRDEWYIPGQVLEEIDRGKALRTWLVGRRSGRCALILQFSFAGQPFAEHFASGTVQEAELTFWPGSLPLRAQMRARLSAVAQIQEALPTGQSIQPFLAGVAHNLSLQPWQERFLCLLHQVVPIYNAQDESWHIRDSAGDALPFVSENSWVLLAISGGAPVDLAAEWDGEFLRPLGALAEGNYTVLGGKK